MTVGRRVVATSPQRPGAATLLFALLTLAACKPDEAAGVPDSGAPSAKAVVSGLRINDEPVPIKQALAIGSEGETALRLVLPSAELSCDALRDSYPERPPSERPVVDFVVMQPLEPSGEAGRWTFLSAHLTDSRGSRGLAALGGMLAELHLSDDGVRAESVELALQDYLGPRELLWSGDVRAHHCGRVAWSAPARPQDKLTLKLGRQELAVAGASLREEAGKQHLRLTRAPHDCNSIFTNSYDIVVDLTLAGEPAQVTLASLSGERLPDSPSASLAKQPVKLSLKAPGLAGRGPLELDIEAQLDLHGYKLTLMGHIDALRCLAVEPAPAASASAMPVPSP